MTDYRMRISRLTIDKLGVKLYDKASAVVSELIANSYDADATEVVVEIPLGTQLAPRTNTTDDADQTAEGLTAGETRGKAAHEWTIVVKDCCFALSLVESPGDLAGLFR